MGIRKLDTQLLGGDVHCSFYPFVIGVFCQGFFLFLLLLVSYQRLAQRVDEQDEGQLNRIRTKVQTLIVIVHYYIFISSA